MNLVSTNSRIENNVSYKNERPHKPCIEHSLANAIQLMGERVGLSDNKPVHSISIRSFVHLALQVMGTNQPNRKINGKLFN